MAEDTSKIAEEIQLIVLRLRDEEFGVEIGQVREIVPMMDITHLPEAPAFIEGVINLRGQVLAVIDLAKQFGLPPLESPPATARIAVIEMEGTSVGLIVDEVPEVVRMPKENIEPTPEIIQTEVHKDYIRGVGKFGERLLILLDLEKVLSHHEVREINTKEVE